MVIEEFDFFDELTPKMQTDVIQGIKSFRDFEKCFNHFFSECERGFTNELIINMYAYWFWKFVKSGWNWFDLLVVTLGLMAIWGALEGPLTLLRNLRAFRVFRLFKRIKSLNKILVSLGRAVPGVSNAGVVITLVMCIYAILGVEFFRDVREPSAAALPRHASAPCAR